MAGGREYTGGEGFEFRRPATEGGGRGGSRLNGRGLLRRSPFSYCRTGELATESLDISHSHVARLPGGRHIRCAMRRFGSPFSRRRCRGAPNSGLNGGGLGAPRRRTGGEHCEKRELCRRRECAGMSYWPGGGICRTPRQGQAAAGRREDGRRTLVIFTIFAEDGVRGGRHTKRAGALLGV